MISKETQKLISEAKDAYDDLVKKWNELVKEGMGYGYISSVLGKLEDEGFNMTNLNIDKIANKIIIKIEAEEPKNEAG
jgi:hypothetical protein